jgi:tetratricopeptide (TPR) repeat protein
MLPGLRDANAVLEAIRKTGVDLDKRNDPLGSGKSDDTKTMAFIQKSLKSTPIPTCYENPLTYMMLMQYVKQIEAARRTLKLPLPTRVDFATFPTTEVDAYTLPADEGRNSVIAVNSQLFMFDYQMTKVTLPTIDISKDEQSGYIKVDHSPALAAERIKSNPDTPTNFTMAVLEFLGLTDSSTQPLAKSYDPLVIELTQGMEMFAVAHEYGHVIKGHSSQRRGLRLGVYKGDGIASQEIAVLDRSWEQEFQADEVGAELLVEALLPKRPSNQSEELKAVYTLRGALFFFTCLSIIDEAKVLRESGKPVPPLTISDRDFLRRYAAGTAAQSEIEEFGALLKGSHPPAWLRSERVDAIITAALANRSIPPSSMAYASIAEGVEANANIIWDAVKPRFPLILAATAMMADGHPTPEAVDKLVALASPATAAPNGPCVIDYKSWPTSFRCNPALGKATSALIEGSAKDTAILQYYKQAVDADWILLSGVQADWAKAELARDKSTDREFALAILALSGNADFLVEISQIDASKWTTHERSALARCKKFLSGYGRETTFSRLVDTPAARYTAADFLSYPKGLEVEAATAASAPRVRSVDLDAFFATFGAADLKGSISPFVASMVYLNYSKGRVADTWADILRQAEKYDPALAYAKEGLATGGPAAGLENTIGNILSAKGDRAGALPHFAASIAAGRLDGWPELNTASNLAKLGDRANAEIWFRRALSRKATVRTQGEYAEYLNDFAWFIATNYPTDSSRMSEALSSSKQAVQITGGTNANFLDTLSECLRLTGDISNAIVIEQAAVEASQNDEQRAEFQAKVAKLKAGK